MATHHGNEGVVKVGANTVTHVQSFELSVTADTVEVHSMGDTWKERLAGQNDWNASVSVLWDETDTTGQGALAEGAAVTLELYPEGEGTGNIYYSGAGIVTEVTRQASLDGRVEASMTVVGNGALAESTDT